MEYPLSNALAHQIIDTYQQHLSQTSSANQAMKHTIEQMEKSPLADRIGKEQVGHFAIDTVLEYRRQQRDLPHEQARERAAYLMTTPPTETGLDVRNYTRSVIDSIKAEPDHRISVMSAHSSIAAEQGRATDDKAFRLASIAYARYEIAIDKGMNHTQAREAVAKEMGDRFDNRATERQGIDVKAYAATIIDANDKGPQVVNRYVNLAVQNRGIAHQDAASIASDAIIKYQRAIGSGIPTQEAKHRVSEQVAQRYNNLGKAISQQHGIER